jgi:hypothetical protein
VAAAADGDFVVAWQSPQDGSSVGVFARSFSSAGVPLTAELQVNTYTTNHQSFPAVATDAEGAFVVAWQSFYQDGYQYGMRARRFSSAGTPLGGELQVSQWTLRSAAQASVDIASDGDFVIAWNNAALDREVFARRFASTGASLTAQFQVNTYTTGYQVMASVASDADGDFVVAWQSYQDGNNLGIFAQRFAALATLDVDGDGATQALTDGLLVLRRFFGLSGVPLTSGVIGAGCTRCDASAIEPYVAALGLVLDIDGNGSTQALADGLLAVRYLFGLRGAALTSGTVGAGCTRCDAMAIEPYVAGLVG